MKARVFAISPDALYRAAIADALDATGMDVFAASSESDARRKLAQGFRAEIVIVQHAPETLDACALTRSLRESAGFAQVPVLLLTDDMKELGALDDCPASAWMRMPFDPAELTALVSALLTQGTQAKEQASA